MRTILLAFALLFSVHSHAQTYKCIENAEVVMSQEKCDAGTEWPVLDESEKASFNFDIAGVRLWMTEQEVVQAMASTLNIKDSDVVLIDPAESNPDAVKKNERNYSVNNENFLYSVMVIDDPDNGGENKTVYFVSLVFKKPHDNVRDDLVQKYGKPTTIKKIGSDRELLYWCPGFQIADQSEVKCSIDGAALTFDQTNKVLQLGDLRYIKLFLKQNIK